MTHWDLSTSRDIAQIGWEPASPRADQYLEEHHDLTIALPADVTIDVAEIGGPARISALRNAVPGPDGRILQMMLIELPRRSVPEAGEFAETLSARFDLPADRFGPWVASNPVYAGGGDQSAWSDSRDLSPDGPSITVKTRMRTGDDAVVMISLVWPDPGLERHRRDSTTTTGPGAGTGIGIGIGIGAVSPSAAA